MNPQDAEAQRLREKFIHQGASALSDVELLWLLLQGISRPEVSLEQMERLLEAHHGNLWELGRADLKSLRMCEGLGVSRAALLSLAMELGRRVRLSEGEIKQTITTMDDVVEIFQPQLGDLPHEEFWALYLNTSNRIVDRLRLSQGGVRGSVVDVRLVVKRAVESLSEGIVLVHNHPSGGATPSEEDRELTAQISRAASLFDIQLLDHVIITSGPCYSFREEGFFDEPLG